jgi:hypothetical protein
MPAAVAIPLITSAITAGTAVTSTVLNNRATGKAADKQTAAADRAAEITRKANEDALKAEQEQQRYDRYRAEAAEQTRRPYVEQGNRTLGTIADLLKVPKVEFPAQTGQQPMFSGGYKGGTLADLYQQPGMPQLSAGQSSGVGSAPQTMGQPMPAMVTLQAPGPDGEIRTVPAAQAEMFIRRGARRIA